MRVEFISEEKENYVFNYELKTKTDQVYRQKTWPKAFIQSIEPQGLLHVKFDRLMKIPDEPWLIQNDTITLNETTYPIIKLQIIPGKYSDTN